mmetsp:Transcript_30632/g.99071  ORF Transcript_30632/g.99071 Transcript_30632/m.99071 type:complete len:268 (-) Transcript_30632:70-873(-)
MVGLRRGGTGWLLRPGFSRRPAGAGGGAGVRRRGAGSGGGCCAVGGGGRRQAVRLAYGAPPRAKLGLEGALARLASGLHGAHVHLEVLEFGRLVLVRLLLLLQRANQPQLLLLALPPGILGRTTRTQALDRRLHPPRFHRRPDRRNVVARRHQRCPERPRRVQLRAQRGLRVGARAGELGPSGEGCCKQLRRRVTVGQSRQLRTAQSPGVGIAAPAAIDVPAAHSAGGGCCGRWLAPREQPQSRLKRGAFVLLIRHLPGELRDAPPQ